MAKARLRLCFWTQNCDGATAIEYSLIAAGIATAIVVIVFTLGGKLSPIFQTIADAL